jgi:hypothetical protein
MRGRPCRRAAERGEARGARACAPGARAPPAAPAPRLAGAPPTHPLPPLPLPPPPHLTGTWRHFMRPRSSAHTSATTSSSVCPPMTHSSWPPPGRVTSVAVWLARWRGHGARGGVGGARVGGCAALRWRRRPRHGPVGGRGLRAAACGPPPPAAPSAGSPRRTAAPRTPSPTCTRRCRTAAGHCGRTPWEARGAGRVGAWAGLHRASPRARPAAASAAAAARLPARQTPRPPSERPPAHPRRPPHT